MSCFDSFVKSALCKYQVATNVMNFIVLVSIKKHIVQKPHSVFLFIQSHIFFSFSMLTTFSVSFMLFLFIVFCVLFVLSSTGFGPFCYWLLLTGKNVSHTSRSCLGTCRNSFDLGDQVCILCL